MTKTANKARRKAGQAGIQHISWVIARFRLGGRNDRQLNNNGTAFAIPSESEGRVEGP